MSLDFRFDDISDDVKNRVDRCWIPDPSIPDTAAFKHDKSRMIVAPVTQGIIFTCMAVGIGHITDENADEFFARSVIWDTLHGQKPFTIEEVRDHIGLRTNVFPNESRAQWVKRILTDKQRGMLTELARQFTRKHKELTANG